jgi:hypothetical protein
MRHFEVPVIAVFTKYDQFLLNVKMDVLDYPDEHPGSNISEEVKRRFEEHYLRPLGDDAKYVRLESGLRLMCQGCMLMTRAAEMHTKDSRCNSLIEKTAAALNDDVVTLMLLAVKKGNLELSVKMALNR